MRARVFCGGVAEIASRAVWCSEAIRAFSAAVCVVSERRRVFSAAMVVSWAVIGVGGMVGFGGNLMVASGVVEDGGLKEIAR